MNLDAGIYFYTGPIVSLIFAAAFFVAWILQPARRYILLFVIAFLALSAASLSQMLRIPHDAGANALVSAVLYTVAILSLIEGVMMRLKATGGAALLFALAAIILVGVYYFFYIDRSVVMRIYIQNFGAGLMFVVAAVQIMRASARRGVDRLIFWVFLIFGLHFFPRTMLTLAMSDHLSSVDADTTGLAQEVASGIFRRSPFWRILNFSLLISTVLIALTLLGALVSDIIEDLRLEGSIDALTGLANRRGFLRRVKTIAGDPSRTPMSVVYCDIDHFKSINDTYGHLAGDQVLQQFGQILLSAVRPQDVAARFGGEEFVILLMQADVSGAELFAERVRQLVERAHFGGLPPQVRLTASFGVTQWRPGEELVVAMNRADRLVYDAKRAGRNHVSAEPAPSTGPAG